MFVVVVQAGTIDGLLRARRRAARAGSRSRDATALDGIGIRLDGERPDVARENGVVGGGIDLVDPPVVGLAVFEEPFRIVRRVRLALVGQVGSADIIRRCAEVDVVHSREFPPASN